MSRYSVILFFSNNHAIWCNELLRDSNLNCKMISVPRELSSDCGYCVRFNRVDRSVVTDLLSSSDIEYDRIEDL